jgi:hypothetical protein
MGERYPEVPRPERKRVRLFGHGGRKVEVELLLVQGKREPWYLAFRDLRGGGLGWTGTGSGGREALGDGALGSVGGRLAGQGVVAHPERRSLF